MKRVIFLVVMLAVVGCVAVRASERMAVVRNGEIFKVIYKGSDLTNVKVVISDAEGNNVFSEKFKSVVGFIRPYNFSQLPKGDYTICVIDNDGENKEKVCFEEIAGTNTKKEWAVHICKLNKVPQKVLVAIPNQGSTGFTIRIFDHNEQLVYEELLAHEADFAKIFRLKDFEKGAIFSVTNNSTGDIKNYWVE